MCYCFPGVAGFKGGNYRGLSLSLSQFKIKYIFRGGAVELCWVRRGFPGRLVYILVLIVRLLSPVIVVATGVGILFFDHRSVVE